MPRSEHDRPRRMTERRRLPVDGFPFYGLRCVDKAHNPLFWTSSCQPLLITTSKLPSHLSSQVHPELEKPEGVQFQTQRPADRDILIESHNQRLALPKRKLNHFGMTRRRLGRPFPWFEEPRSFILLWIRAKPSNNMCLVVAVICLYCTASTFNLTAYPQSQMQTQHTPIAGQRTSLGGCYFEACRPSDIGAGAFRQGRRHGTGMRPNELRCCGPDRMNVFKHGTRSHAGPSVADTGPDLR
ncbi:hypothetical protein C8F01DRAFT_1085694 [Mycena amicta]|nr:hypothetical protein C8F01DRAFT_1085694 [Mycena amicta]